MRLAVCGGVYSNPYALRAFCADAERRGADRLYCLGDLGGYGAEPDEVWPLLVEREVNCIAGNYDVAIAAAGGDCGCGYRDPRDRQYAQLMYDYTLSRTSGEFASWMSSLPTERREEIAGCDAHFVHGSPLAVNDFWWESLAGQTHALKVAASRADLILATHSGLPWIKRIDDTLVVNVGVIGRPANDGTRSVSYALVDIVDGRPAGQIVPLSYDWQAQAASMRAAGLPEAFTRTNETGWWTTCLEVLPPVERSRGRYHVYDSSVPALLEAAGVGSPWPDSDPAIPVRALVGSPLLPARVWIDGPDSLAQAAARLTPWGAVDIQQVRDAPSSSSADGDLGRIEPTLSSAGWFSHPDRRDGPPLSAPGTEAPLRADQTTDAFGALVHRLLLKLETAGALSSPVACAIDAAR